MFRVLIVLGEKGAALLVVSRFVTVAVDHSVRVGCLSRYHGRDTTSDPALVCFCLNQVVDVQVPRGARDTFDVKRNVPVHEELDVDVGFRQALDHDVQNLLAVKSSPCSPLGGKEGSSEEAFLRGLSKTHGRGHRFYRFGSDGFVCGCHALEMQLLPYLLSMAMGSSRSLLELEHHVGRWFLGYHNHVASSS